MKLSPSSIVLATGMALWSGLGTAAPHEPTPPVPVDPTPFVLMQNSPLGCPDFDVTGSVTGSGKFINLPGGGQIAISPNLRITLMANGNSVSYVITGASHIEPLPDGNTKVRATGRNLILVPLTNSHPKGLFLTSGNVDFTIDSNGNEVQVFSGPGKVVDVCAALAI